jgi:hypothetical protein
VGVSVCFSPDSQREVRGKCNDLSIDTMYLITHAWPAVRVGLCVGVLLTCSERELPMGICICACITHVHIMNMVVWLDIKIYSSV